ncbi:MAG: thioredoxin domain-containing protein [Pyrinomonadaceae bacterium]
MKRNYLSSALIYTAVCTTAFISACTGAATPNNAGNRAAATPKVQATMPPNAPAGAQPPNMSGSASAPVTVEEFADFQCGACASIHPVMNEIKSMYGSRIRFIYRNYPLEMHDKAYDAAVAAEAAGLQGKFWDMQNLLFTNQKNWVSSNTYKQTFKEYAGKLGLDVAKWENDIIGLPAKTRVDADKSRAKALGIAGTPTLYINNTTVEFKDMNVQTLKTLIDAELQKAVSAPAAQPANSNAAPAATPGNQNK